MKQLSQEDNTRNVKFIRDTEKDDMHNTEKSGSGNFRRIALQNRKLKL